MSQENIRFAYQTDSFGFPNRNRLKKFLAGLFRKEGKKLSAIQYVFVNDEYLLTINQQHLRHNTYTDIITFDLSVPGQPIEAEIYISIERVKENAPAFGTSFQKELHRVIFHGALHLCGYKDKSEDEARLMRKMEDRYLNLYFK